MGWSKFKTLLLKDVFASVLQCHSSHVMKCLWILQPVNNWSNQLPRSSSNILKGPLFDLIRMLKLFNCVVDHPMSAANFLCNFRDRILNYCSVSEDILWWPTQLNDLHALCVRSSGSHHMLWLTFKSLHLITPLSLVIDCSLTCKLFNLCHHLTDLVALSFSFRIILGLAKLWEKGPWFTLCKHLVSLSLLGRFCLLPIICGV